MPLLKASSANPCIVSMSSVAGRLGYAFRTPYAASKWAVVGLTKSLAARNLSGQVISVDGNLEYL